MPIQNKLPIFRKMYSFTIIMHRAVHNMPREYRYSLGVETVNICWNCMDLITVGAGLKKEMKKEKILDLSEKFDCLKLRLRAMEELKIISIGQFAHWQENYMDEIGRQIGGWIKEC